MPIFCHLRKLRDMEDEPAFLLDKPAQNYLTLRPIY